MSQDKEKKVVGIGHNSGNTVSKEAYEKSGRLEEDPDCLNT